MTLLFMEGFEDLTDDDELESKWDVYNVYLDNPTTYGYSINVGGGRFGGNCLQCPQTQNTNIFKSVSPTDTLVQGVAYKFDSGAYCSTSNYILRFLCNASDHIRIQHNTSGQIRSYGGSTVVGSSPTSDYSSYNMTPGTWYYIEAKVYIHDTNGYVIVKVNGVEWINTGLVDTLYLNATQFVGVSIGSAWGANSYFDDFYVCDTNGTKNNDFLGDVRVSTLKPASAGTNSDFTPSAGNNYECVDDADWSNVEADYVSSTVDGDIDTYNFDAVPTNLGAVKGIQVNNGSKRYVESDSTQIKHVVRSNSTEYFSGAKSLTDDPYQNFEIWEEDPDDSADWTKTKIDACEFGVQSVIP